MADKCTCNIPFLIVSAILFTIGLWLVVGGVAMQFKAASFMFDGMTAGLYFVGVLFLFFGKMAAWKSHGSCPVHGMKK